MSRSTSKRQIRAEDSNNELVPLQDRTRDPALWFEDGSVILASGTKLFRVHKSFLAKTSEVFADLFSVPQPAQLVEGTDMYQGLPLVYLAGDDEEDVLHFLKCIYERSYYRSSAPTPFPVITGLVRLATKYGVLDIRNEALAHLARRYPLSWDEFEKVVESDFQLLRTNIIVPANSSYIDLLFDLLRVAREASADILLPTIFLDLARFTSKDIASAATDPINGPARILDVFACLHGREALIVATRKVVLRFIDDNASMRCTTHLACNSGKKAALANWEIWNYFTTNFHGFLPTDKMVMVWRNALCSQCLEVFRASVATGRRELWSGLPKFFGLPSWEELKRRAS